MSLTINIYDESKFTVKTYKGFDEDERIMIDVGDNTFTMTLEQAIKLHEALEKVVVASEYQYENMQKENDELQQRILDLEEVLDNIGYEEAV